MDQRSNRFGWCQGSYVGEIVPDQRYFGAISRSVTFLSWSKGKLKKKSNWHQNNQPVLTRHPFVSLDQNDKGLKRAFSSHLEVIAWIIFLYLGLSCLGWFAQRVRNCLSTHRKNEAKKEAFYFVIVRLRCLDFESFLDFMFSCPVSLCFLWIFWLVSTSFSIVFLFCVVCFGKEF